MRKIVFAALLGLAACGGYATSRPLAVDGTRNANFGQDEIECRALAANYNPQQQAGAIGGGAVSGAVIGGLTSASGESTEGALAGAAIGGLLGAAEGSYQEDEARRQVLINCMQGRGHRVIG